jgi:acetylornithine deacetylase/succinyl-diaminopimelate desuccinylase-like protein
MLHGSNQENVLPVSAEAIVQCRLLPGDSAERVRDALASLVSGTGVTVTPTPAWGSGPAPALEVHDAVGVPSPAAGEVPDAIRRVTRRLLGDVPVVEGFGFGASDDRYLTARGARIYGTSPNPTSIEDSRLGFDAHGPDERVSARWYAEGVRWLNALALELAR